MYMYEKQPFCSDACVFNILKQYIHVLCVQVTNQMITACKAHITENGTIKIWEVDVKELLKRFQVCHDLSTHYQESFQRSKERAKSASRSFEVSEMYVFGKFGSFCRRLMQIQELIETIEKYKVLKMSKIEGLDGLATKFGHLVSAMKKKPYSPLDHRKMDFIADYQDFQRQLAELEDQIINFMVSIFSKITSTFQTLKLLRQ